MPWVDRAVDTSLATLGTSDAGVISHQWSVLAAINRPMRSEITGAALPGFFGNGLPVHFSWKQGSTIFRLIVNVAESGVFHMLAWN